MTDLVYPEHKHPHFINKPENPERIWACSEGDCYFTDTEIREDAVKEEWGHKCRCSGKKGMRCESHLESYMPDP